METERPDESASPPPQMSEPRSQLSLMTVCITTLTICIVGGVLTILRPVITPLLIALFLFFLVNPLLVFCERNRISTWLAYLLVFVLGVLGVYAILWIIDVQAQAFVEQWPEYQERAQVVLDRYAGLLHLTNKNGKFDWNRYGLDDLLPVSQEETITYLVELSVGLLEAGTMALFYLLFMLFEARTVEARVKYSLQPDSATRVLDVIESMNNDIWRYLVAKTAVSAGLGISTALLGLGFGLDFWLLWGFLMFLANYITYVGSIVALGPPMLLSFVQFEDPIAAGAFCVLLVLARFAWIDYFEIRYSGRHVNVSPLLLLFGLALMGWMWGVVGMLLAVPLITSVRIALGSHPKTEYMARLMSDMS